MRLQMEVTNQEVLHGEEMVREVLMDMLREMRPPPQHNAFDCRNCQWVERRGKVMLKPCENSPAYRPACQDYGFHARFFTFILSNSLHFR